MARYSFDPLTKTFAELTPTEDAAMSPRSRMIGGHLVALTVQEAAELEAIELTNELESATDSAQSRIVDGMSTAIAAGYTCTNGVTVNSTPEDVTLMFLGLQKAERGNRPSVSFRDHTGTVHALTPNEVNDMLIEAGDNLEAIFANKWTREAEIDAIVTDGVMTDAEKVAALNAIVW